MTPRERELLRHAIGQAGELIVRHQDALPLVAKGWLTPSRANRGGSFWRITKEGRAAYAADVDGRVSRVRGAGDCTDYPKTEA